MIDKEDTVKEENKIKGKNKEAKRRNKRNKKGKKKSQGSCPFANKWFTNGQFLT